MNSATPSTTRHASPCSTTPSAKRRYHALRARGTPHGGALGTAGDRLLRLLAVACAMLRNGTLYDSNLSRAKVAA